MDGCKKVVTQHNKTYKLSDVKMLFNNALQNITKKKNGKNVLDM